MEHLYKRKPNLLFFWFLLPFLLYTGYAVGKQSKGESAGKSGSSSSNYDVIGRDLLTPDS